MGNLAWIGLVGLETAPRRDGLAKSLGVEETASVVHVSGDAEALNLRAMVDERPALDRDVVEDSRQQVLPRRQTFTETPAKWHAASLVASSTG